MAKSLGSCMARVDWNLGEKRLRTKGKFQISTMFIKISDSSVQQHCSLNFELYSLCI